ncbi:MAG: hypothetical protein ACYS74_05770 [Planctomycetota bacterium]
MLESEDVGKIMEATGRTASFESRMAVCEDRSNQGHNQLAEHETKLSELAATLGATEQTANRNETGLAEVSKKTASLESRMAGCEDRANQAQNQLVQHETKVNELSTKLGAAEQVLDGHAAAFDESTRNMQVLADAIQSLEEFQTATEKARSLILAAFNDMRASISPEEGLGPRLEPAKPEETPQGPEQGQEEAEGPM